MQTNHECFTATMAQTSARPSFGALRHAPLEQEGRRGSPAALTALPRGRSLHHLACPIHSFPTTHCTHPSATPALDRFTVVPEPCRRPASPPHLAVAKSPTSHAQIPRFFLLCRPGRQAGSFAVRLSDRNLDLAPALELEQEPHLILPAAAADLAEAASRVLSARRKSSMRGLAA
ncbi:hypothetical protein BC567DRAFT_225429 [Phyllosticta citribraziliensis]